MQKIFLGLKSVVAVGSLIFLILLGYQFFFKEESPVYIAEVPEEKEEVRDETLKLIFVGDMMLDRGVRNSIYKNYGGDYNILFEYTGYLGSADLVIGNLEGPASDLGRNVGSIYSFRMEPESLLALQSAGFDALSMANNHAGDWTSAAHRDTVRRLVALGITPLGQGENLSEALSPKVFVRKGISLALFACSDVGPVWMKAGENTAGILLCDEAGLLPALEEARKNYDHVIVMPHWGDEYVGFSDRQRAFATRFIDHGATAVIGHHPHVAQASEWYGGGFIAYSLGNFIFDQYFSPETMRGLVLEMTVGKEGIVSVDFKVSEQNKTFQPQPLRDLEPGDIIENGVI